jgi:segregation and condensation protein B
MSEENVIPELKQILGALVLGAGRPVSSKELRQCLVDVAGELGADAAPFAEVKPKEVSTALAELAETVRRAKIGFELEEAAGGYRFATHVACGKWLRHLLQVGKPQKLSRPALETLAIIAYRQPVTRATIEGIRGVNAGHILKSLMELQLVRITGRSELPGRPFTYGTTQLFLDHFGLRGLKDLSDVEPMLALSGEHATGQGSGARGSPPAADETGGQDEGEAERGGDEPAEASDEDTEEATDGDIQ